MHLIPMFKQYHFELCSWFFEHWGQGSNLSRTRPLFTRVKSNAVYICGLSVGHGYLSMAVFILIYRSHSYRWAAVVPRSNLQSWALSCRVHTSIMLLPMCTWKQNKNKNQKKKQKQKKRSTSLSFKF